MKLHAPFIISARLMPALRIGGATLHLETIVRASGEEPGTRVFGPRHAAGLILDLPDGTEYRDNSMQSGCGGFGSAVEVFETFLSFLSSAAESLAFTQRTGIKGDCADLFPPHVTQWARDNLMEIEGAQCELQDEEGNARAELLTD